MRYPTVKFEISPTQDVKNYLAFVKYSEKRFLPMFLPAELKKTLNDRTETRSKITIVKKFVENEFGSHHQEIKKSVAASNSLWRTYERQYFELMQEVFKDHPWPKGKYIGYASVFKMYPRDVSDKVFFFDAFDAKHALKTTAHEMTHFIFFDYLKKKFGLNVSSVITGRGARYVWNVSEVFNLTMETWSPYQKIFKTSGQPYDSMHARMLPRMKRIWRKNPDIDHLLKQYFGRPK